MAPPRAVIFGCAGPALSVEERALFAEADPFGFILFGRNVESPDQLRALTDALRDAVGRDAPVLIDQEGGRVQRLRPPHWRQWEDQGETAARLDESAAEEALRLRAALIARELRAVGITVNCAPCLDLRIPGAHAVIAARALARDPWRVARLGAAILDGLAQGGVRGVVKHLPGHGRARADSHQTLPRIAVERDVLEREDAHPFARNADAAIGMTAHILYTALDPEAAVTLSPAAIRFIRETIGFSGLLLSDDLAMNALDGPDQDRAAAALAAGCDIALHCSGDFDAMRAVAEAVSPLQGEARARARRAAVTLPPDPGFDPDWALARLRALGAAPLENADA